MERSKNTGIDRNQAVGIESAWISLPCRSITPKVSRFWRTVLCLTGMGQPEYTLPRVSVRC